MAHIHNKTDIIIVGAGASGLAAARELAKAGKKVTVLEARPRTGGRIYTLTSGFSRPVEAGAEFVHGNLPHTLQVLTEAGILYEEMEGTTWQIYQGKPEQDAHFIENQNLLNARLGELTEDMPLDQFLNTYFQEEKYSALKESVIGFVEGYDAADSSKASTFALRDEWAGEDDASQYRFPEGYSQLIGFLEKESKAAGAHIHLSCQVKEINWRPGKVEATTHTGHSFAAPHLLLTVPLGILQQAESAEAAIRFLPAIAEKITAARQIGFGGVIKFLFEFKNAFWDTTNPATDSYRKMANLGFLFSDAPIPTWWTQLPDPAPVLTGWLAGPKAAQYAAMSEAELRNKALQSLAYVFDAPIPFLEQQLITSHITNWLSDPFACGAYSYATLNTPDAKKMLNQPIDNTLYFAGEALYEGTEMGTVEAALASGLATARKILQASGNYF